MIGREPPTAEKGVQAGSPDEPEREEERLEVGPLRGPWRVLGPLPAFPQGVHPGEFPLPVRVESSL